MATCGAARSSHHKKANAYQSMTALEITTRRLILRPRSVDEIGETECLVADLRIATNLGRFWGPPPESQISIRTNSTGELIGGIDFQRGRISYFINPTCWGKGYGFEAVNAASNYLISEIGVRSLRADVLESNAASRRILQRTGFVFVCFDRVLEGDTERICVFELRKKENQQT